MRRPYGWAGSVEAFLDSPIETVVSPLEQHLYALLRMHASGSQVDAWHDEVSVLHRAFRDAAIARSDLLNWGLVLEYELHLEGGRRPDAVLLTGTDVVAMEFKHKDHVNIADLDQASAYARDLAEYHSGSHSLDVSGVLVPTRMRSPRTEVDGVHVLGPADLAAFFAAIPGEQSVDIQSWVDADYAPIPSLIEAARLIFREEGLPRIKRCWSSGVPEAVELLGQITEACSDDSTRALAFLAGVPGAGKTLAGLQLVYERSQAVGPAVFLSGNGPLVEVLRGALESKTFVKDLHAFIKTYSQTTRIPDTNVVVFDEAQRAWDSDYMNHKKGIDASEPDLLIQIGERVTNWCTLVGLVGDGQEIHAGEEAGIGQWATAVRTQAQRHWQIHCPPRMAAEFSGLDVRADERLDLTVTLRSKRAERLHDWVRELLAGNLASAARIAQLVRGNAFPLYLTRELDDAKEYVRQRYSGDLEARYGLIASSRTQTFLPKFGVDTSWPATKRVKYAQWYNNGPGEPGSGCNFEDVVTEFGCQGLELDMPLVAWGADLMWTGHDWLAKKPRGGYPLHDAEQLRINAYRVLLTRGRDGLVVFVPPSADLDSTETALLAAGLQPLPIDLAIAV
jgi:DUF2075 family protein